MKEQLQINAWEDFKQQQDNPNIAIDNKQKVNQQNEQVKAWNNFGKESDQKFILNNNQQGKDLTAWKDFTNQNFEATIGKQKMQIKNSIEIQEEEKHFKTENLTLMQKLKLLTATMPELQQWVKKQNIIIQTINAVLRGIGQVVFMNNPISGLFILFAILLSSQYQGLCMLLGVTVSTVTSLLLEMDQGSFENGLYGYNGTLVGAGISLFQFGNDQNFVQLPQVIFPILFMSAMSTIFTAGIGRIFVKNFGLSPYTIPFILCVWIWVAGAYKFSYFPINGNILSPAIQTTETTMAPIISQTWDGSQFIQGVFRGVSQVYFQSNTASGVIILVGMAFCSPISSFFAFFGSLISTLTAMGLGVGQKSLYDGLWGFSGVLSAIAIGGMFFVLKGTVIYFYVAMGAILSAILNGCIGSVLSPIGLPSLTFPFNLVCWIFCSAGTSIKGLFSVELAAISTPEDHRKRFLLIKEMTSKFRDIKEFQDILTLDNPEDLQRIEKLLVPALLCWYASIGDIKNLKMMIKLDCDLNNGDYDGRTALHLASAEEQIETIQLLLQRKAKTSNKDRYQETAMNDAIRSLNFKVVKLLKQNSVENVQLFLYVGLKQSQDYLIGINLCMAAAENNTSFIQCALTAGISLQSHDYDGRTALHIAVSKNNSELCQLLINWGADPSFKDHLGNSPKDDAKNKNKSAILKILEQPIMIDLEFTKPGEQKLKQYNFNKNSQNTRKLLISIILCKLSADGNISKVRELLNKLDEPVTNFFDYDQRTPLHVATSEGKLEMVQFLLTKGFNVNAVDRWGQTPLWEAIQNRFENLVKVLTSFKGTILFTDIKLSVILCQIIVSNDIELLKIMIRAGINLNVKDYDDRTPLHIAGEAGLTKIYNILLKGGANPNAKDIWGKIPNLNDEKTSMHNESKGGIDEETKVNMMKKINFRNSKIL